MGLSYGFFDNIDGKPAYNADDFNQLQNALITDGVFIKACINNDIRNNKQFEIVKAASELSYIIRPGKARFNDIWIINTDEYLINLESVHEVSCERYDYITIKIDKRKTQRNANFVCITGTEVTDQPPVFPEIPVADDEYYYPIAYVHIVKQNNIITSTHTSLISTEKCPYVLNILEIPDLDTVNNLNETIPGKMLDARQGAVLSNMAPFSFAIDSSGKYGYIKNGEFIPF